MSYDVIIIGSGIGGLCAGALLAKTGRKVLICESHSLPGGAAHSFSRDGFHFDSGPSFYCALNPPSSNPLTLVLESIGESLPVIPYDPLGYYHFPDFTFPVYCNLDRYTEEVSKITPQGAEELKLFHRSLLALDDCLKDISILHLSADWRVVFELISRSGLSLLKALPQLDKINSSTGRIMDRFVSDSWVRQLIDLECFLLSGLKAEGTIAPEIAFMLGERNRCQVEYPIGGSGAIIEALIRGFKRFGGEIRLNSHVEKILVNTGKVTGIKLRRGETIAAPIIISNASIWDTYSHLLNLEDLPSDYRRQSLATPPIDSFIHLHLGIKAEGLKNLDGHHVVIHNPEVVDITTPGNTCMISIPSVWDYNLCPPEHHLIHAYTLEPYGGWEKNENYAVKKRERAESLYRAIAKIIPDIRDRIVLELIGTPLTHQRYLRRYRGTYGPGIPAGKGLFPSCHTPISGLYRVGDSTLPGIGVPAVAASGIFCANTIL